VYTDDITAAAQCRKKLAQSSFLPHITDCVSQPATQVSLTAGQVTWHDV
jgi:hypothetical protein